MFVSVCMKYDIPYADSHSVVMFKRHSMPPPSALPPLLSHSGIPAGHRQQTIETRAHLYLTARCPRPRRGPRRPPVHQPDVDRNTPNRADTPQLRRRWRLHGSVVVGARNKVLKSDGEPASAWSSPVITVRPRTGRALAVGDCGWTFHGTADGAETTRSSASPATRPVAGSARAAQARLARLGAERGAHVIPDKSRLQIGRGGRVPLPRLRDLRPTSSEPLRPDARTPGARMPSGSCVSLGVSAGIAGASETRCSPRWRRRRRSSRA